ncbi:MAG: hypothetical protein VYE34_05765, partial [Pseudomonadota bacterium]|nr:hypothetical protein [Pseudomonadota bacterium]
TVYGYTPSGKDITYGLNGESFEGYLVSAGEDAKGSVLIVPQRRVARPSNGNRLPAFWRIAL